MSIRVTAPAVEDDTAVPSLVLDDVWKTLRAGGEERENAEAVPPFEGRVGALAELVCGVRVDGPEAVREGDVVDGPERVGAVFVGDGAGPPHGVA